MKSKTLFIVVVLLLLSGELSYAIRPSTKYNNTPKEMGLQYEELLLHTRDGADINVWHLPSINASNPIIIAESDAGNMADWLYLAAYLQSSGTDVWLFDYRGFGSSSYFEIHQQFLYYQEFVEDLNTVVEKVVSSTGKNPVLLGLSMGSIVITEYLKQTKYSISKVIFDGYVCNPYVWKERLSAIGKEIIIPDGYKKEIKIETPELSCLYIVSKYDSLSKEEDIPQIENSIVEIQRYKCAHLEAFYKHPRRYIRRIINFVNNDL